MHATIDVLAGLLVVVFVTNWRTVWEQARRTSEQIANSWRQWEVGNVRIINHSGYAAATAFVGLAIVGLLTGPHYLASLVIMGLSIIVTSALWAQLIEGSPALLRPYGWYGGVLGALAGAFFASISGASVWLLLGAFCVAAPWIQALGRLRCLVQGCCHGREAAPGIGIRYTHPHSRVCKLAALSGVPLHPTPLYSIGSNLIIGVVMARLWSLHVAVSLVIGLFLILTGLSRFVEEAYRGEPQTPVKAGLKIYQWLAILGVFAGVVTTMIGSAPQAPAPQPNWQSLGAAAGFALIAFVALGVDFPKSTRRFARLA
jgi:prolipoprotein diacylglyceryltransferase